MRHGVRVRLVKTHSQSLTRSQGGKNKGPNPLRARAVHTSYAWYLHTSARRRRRRRSFIYINFVHRASLSQRGKSRVSFSLLTLFMYLSRSLQRCVLRACILFTVYGLLFPENTHTRIIWSQRSRKTPCILCTLCACRNRRDNNNSLVQKSRRTENAQTTYVKRLKDARAQYPCTWILYCVRRTRTRTSVCVLYGPLLFCIGLFIIFRWCEPSTTSMFDV